jgi:hypothetical protein
MLPGWLGSTAKAGSAISDWKETLSEGLSGEFQTDAGRTNCTGLIVIGIIFGLRFLSVPDAFVAIVAIFNKAPYHYEQPSFIEVLISVATLAAYNFTCMYVLGNQRINKSKRERS